MAPDTLARLTMGRETRDAEVVVPGGRPAEPDTARLLPALMAALPGSHGVRQIGRARRTLAWRAQEGNTQHDS